MSAGPDEPVLDGDEGIRLVDRVEAEAFRDYVLAAPRPFAERMGLAVREVEGATALRASGIPDPFFNRVIGLGSSGPPSASALDSLGEWYQAAGCRSWWVHVSPYPRAEDLARRLTSRGFVPPTRRSWAKMIRGTEPAPRFETSLDIRAAEAGDVLPMAAAITEAYGMPPAFGPWFEAVAERPHWQGFVATSGDEVVGGGLLFVRDNTGWLGAGGVVPAYRGRNAHRALMAARIDSAIAAGCRFIVTETGEPVGDEPNPSLANMRRCGFQQVCSRLNYAAPPA